MINVLNKYHFKNLPHNSFFVDRSTPLGNPYSHSKKITKAKFFVETREEAVKKYQPWLLEQIENKDKDVLKILNLLLKTYLKSGELNLVCSCKPKMCHADIIKTLIENMAKCYMSRIK